MNKSRMAGALLVRDGGDDLSTEETPGLRPILLVLGAMFAFSLMAVFTRGAQANILGVAAWRAIIVAVVFAISAIATEGGTTTMTTTTRTSRRLAQCSQRPGAPSSRRWGRCGTR